MIMEFFGLALALISQLGIGRRLIKGDGLTAILASLLVISAIVSPLAYYQVSYIKYLLLIWSIIGLFLFIYDEIFKKTVSFSVLQAQSRILYFSLFIFFLVYFSSIHSSNYIYESHDLVYFSWVRDFLRAEYTGPLRVSVAWPNFMAVNHLMPGAVISALSVFIIHPTIVTAIEFKYVLIALYFSSFIFTWKKTRNIPTSLSLILFLCVFTIYGQEIGYSLRISSFLYIIIFIELLKASLFNGRDKDIVFFASFLIIAKAPIFFIAAVTAIWYLWKAPKVRFHFSTISSIFLVLINIASWLYAPSPAKNSISLGFATPFSLQSISALNDLKSWFIPDTVYNALNTSLFSPVFTLILIIYIFVKYYIIYFITSPLANSNNFSKVENFEIGVKDRLIGLDLYVFTSLFTWLFIRHNSEIMHVAHAYILMALLTSINLMDFLIRHNKTRLVTLLVFTVIYGIGNSINPFYYSNNETSKSTSAVRLSSLLPNHGIDGFYVPPEGEHPGVSQVKAAMYGLKLNSITTPSPPDSQITNWLVQE